MNNEFLDSDFDLKGFVPFLDKSEVSEKTKVEIVDIKRGNSLNRPLFYAEFPEGVKKFDLPIKETEKIINAYGSRPRDWITKEIEIKSEFYKNKQGRTGLTLVVYPL